MNPKLRFALQLLLVAAVAALSCWLTGRLLKTRHGHIVVSDHYAIHKELALTSEQEKALERIEQRYEARWKELEAEIGRANLELAAALRRDKSASPEMTAAVGKITRAQGELQKATLDHVFAMKPFLTPGQYQRLIELCADSLEESVASARTH